LKHSLFRYIVLWTNDEGEECNLEVSSSIGFFIGRPTIELAKLGASDYTGVYFYFPSEKRVNHTGIRDLRVSMLHLKVMTTPEGIIVKDHGPKGEGSTNGTFVNDIRLGKGEKRFVKPSVRVKLGSSGPIFTFLAKKPREKPMFSLEANVPHELPLGIGKRLVNMGFTSEVKFLPNSVVVVLKPHVSGETDYALVNSVKLSENAEKKLTMYKLIDVLGDALLHIKSGRVDDARVTLSKIELKQYRRLIENLGDENVVKEYSNVIFLTKQREIYLSALENHVLKLKTMLKELVNKLS